MATLLVEGPEAISVVQAQFRAKSGRPLKSYSAEQVVFGHFGPTPGEEVVVRRRGEDSVELHCHGGLAAVAMIERALAAAGCRSVGWRDWIADHSSDPITAAAQAALAEAATERTATILLDQYHGALRRALEAIAQAVDNHDHVSAREQIDTLLAHAAVGLHLVRPWQVVLAGRPNVGKSSLINALVGYPRAIVHPAPGTTRDVVSVRTAIDGWPVELADTAGLHPGGEAVEQAGMERARQRLSTADLVILVFERSAPWCRCDQELLESRPEGLVVHSKCDLPPAAGSRVVGLATSALQAEGIAALAKAIVNRLIPDPPPPGAAVPFSSEHLAQLARLSECAAVGRE